MVDYQLPKEMSKSTGQYMFISMRTQKLCFCSGLQAKYINFNTDKNDLGFC